MDQVIRQIMALFTFNQSYGIQRVIIFSNRSKMSSIRSREKVRMATGIHIKVFNPDGVSGNHIGMGFENHD
jgi:hypothetical protein